MRATWLVLGALLIGGGAAYWQLRSGAGREDGGGADRPAVPLGRETPAAAGPASATSTGLADPRESDAERLLTAMADAKAQKDGARYGAALQELRREAWDTQAARRFAVESGWNLQRELQALETSKRIPLADRARRLLSRGVLLPEYFSPAGEPTPERIRLTTTIQALNAQVMTYARGLEGVTRPYVVPAGASPVGIVTEERLPTGHNAILFWNKRGNLDPKRLVAGETLLLPVEELHVHVEIDRRLLLLFLGDAYVKEFPVGVGKTETPTPRGEFRVGKKQGNPDWYPQGRGRIPAGDPRNELGSVWIHIRNDQHPEGYGIHGTNRPETVGSACSEGCVRLENEQASEVFWWVRMGSNGGQPTRVVLR